jgi:hypothetical protein
MMTRTQEKTSLEVLENRKGRPLTDEEKELLLAYEDADWDSRVFTGKSPGELVIQQNGCIFETAPYDAQSGGCILRIVNDCTVSVTNDAIIIKPKPRSHHILQKKKRKAY